MKDKLKWLLDLAETKPLIFSLALLLIAISTLCIVIENRELQLEKCQEDGKVLKLNYDRKVDSVIRHFDARQEELEAEVKQTLNRIIDGYKDQLKDQKRLNDTINTTINENKKIIQTKNLVQ